jgi:hypothetical protein
MAFSNGQVAPAGATPGGCPERVRTASSCSEPQGRLPSAISKGRSQAGWLVQGNTIVEHVASEARRRSIRGSEQWRLCAFWSEILPSTPISQFSFVSAFSTTMALKQALFSQSGIIHDGLQTVVHLVLHTVHASYY